MYKITMTKYEQFRLPYITGKILQTKNKNINNKILLKCNNKQHAVNI